MKNIKLIVFDLDGTFYDLRNVIEGVYNCQLKFLCQQRNITPDEARTIFTRNSIFPYPSENAKSCTEYFESIGIRKADWAAFRESNFDVTKIDPATAVAPAVISQFAARYKIYLISSNTRQTIERVLGRLQIDAHLFADIICSDRFVSTNPFNKREAMAAIMQRCALQPSDCLSVGDRYNTDIRPMLELGGCGVLVKTPQSLVSLLGGLATSNLGNSNTYEYFTNDCVKEF